ncbi:Rid family detoxifying hydrolase [Candidatus Palibaumannia cicadellinicola]|uniref:Putative endoribonuclease L-PSP n=1 Tax=Baumannia cicadellinicola subsp. Homalodisca coagulata TaxID=374463 RepID=Q1LTK4_BAUCH|nr:Rid family detoxifying hydrolase [Candidatus Baumannia cicadellinicola]ABF14344.1 putative endoribonuclease L-PSP [Baumannia cicadellinicola str. Hc (Homalodisca coagulata)]MBS0032703.1 Rid family detoxifying hydrolase [Candidatus Baumannia cicadellinicola]MCJ7462307.1 Rid family detoxifying hydrolase [Candidatus Baumannia cicadellinicola]MCJ7462827.1 Rid family detoxifying hydrolase [Candidatus Baumannia cicadellinicola]
MNHIIHTQNAPAAIGPYVQARNIGLMTFISGQIPICPLSGKIADNIIDQTKQSLQNIKAIVEAIGSNVTIANIIKTTIFLIDINQLSVVNTIYESFFTEHHAPFPARTCVEVSRLPKNVNIEIEAIVAIYS